LLVQFPLEGKTVEIKGLFSTKAVEVESIRSDAVSQWRIPEAVRDVIVDVSGLAKPAIFHFCQHVLESRGVLKVCHSQAAQYFPSDDDLGPLLRAHDEEDVARLLEGAATLFTGEEKPYKSVSLLTSTHDDSRQRALLAFSSAKHERLLELLDGRYYDYVGIAYSSAANGRGGVSELAARFAARNINGAECYAVSPTDLRQNLDFLTRLFYELYHESGYNIEIGLTGSKLSGVAAAILASRWKIAQAWYVSPAKFSPDRFTTGMGATQVYVVSSVDELRSLKAPALAKG
jgi:hypothetical protein